MKRVPCCDICFTRSLLHSKLRNVEKSYIVVTFVSHALASIHHLKLRNVDVVFSRCRKVVVIDEASHSNPAG